MSATPLVDPAAPPVRSQLLGIVSFVLALVAYLSLPILVAALAGADADPGVIVGVPIVVFAGIAVLGIVAAVTGRGRGWAISGIVIAVANGYSPLHTGVVLLLGSIFG